MTNPTETSETPRQVAYNPGSLVDFCGTARPSYPEQRRWEKEVLEYQLAMLAVRRYCDTSQCNADCKISSLL